MNKQTKNQKPGHYSCLLYPAFLRILFFPTLIIVGVIFLMLLFFSCNQKKTLFTSLSPGKTGIHFQNLINETDSFNILDYLYFYNGGGVAIGDINNDGLPDIYFTSNQGSNKLYLNKGSLHFEDITETAGVAGKGNWKTGVTMADVNADGLLDLYVSEVGKYKSLQGRNELFINNGNNSFTERAKEFGLDMEGFNTQASFFDYDKDGDLDVFIVNHSVHSTETYVDATERHKKNAVSGDKLMRCEQAGDSVFFTDVTTEAGIYSSALGYGLNVVVGDFNNDNWDDVYVSNDFHENDYYYINNRNGTFDEKNKEAFGHESRFSMGSDAADINNDGWLDLVTLDMLPADEKILKSSVSDDPLDIYQFKMEKGYHHQYAKNCLQLNVYGGKRFSDISLFAGVAATDWSWSPLLADFNNDGIKDLFVTTGVLKRPNDLDYIKFISSGAISADLQKGRSADRLAIEKMPSGKIANAIYSGTKEMRFVDESMAWGFTEAGLSNGAAYADLDNDGDLDIVTNNINAPASVYQNNFQEEKKSWLKIQLAGEGKNSLGFGSKVILKNKGDLQVQYVTATRGFESASVAPLHFGLGDHDKIDTVQIIWPDGKMQTITNVAANHQLLFFQKNAGPAVQGLLPNENQFTPLFSDVTDSISLNFKHVENNFIDFNVQQLIPHGVSTQGPKLAVADINADGLDDFFIGGAKGQAGKLFIQNLKGAFVSVNEELLIEDAACEDVDAVFFDADGDGDKDLYVVSGGNELAGNEPALLDRLYKNDGKGKFSKSATLPHLYENKSVAVASDFDADGDVDLFVGGRAVAGSYGFMPSSHLLVNDGKGNFKPAPGNIAPGLQHMGMVTGAVWTDIDKDGWKDLVVVGEWMPITVFKNQKGKFKNVTVELGLENTTGLWTTIATADLDADGFEDLLAGNWGENSKLRANERFPLLLYVGDVDKNGSVDQFLGVAKNGDYYTFLGKEEIEKALPGVIRKNYLDYRSMAGKTIENILTNHLPVLKQLSAKTLSSVLIKNTSGKLTVSVLPSPVQWSPVFSFSTGDFNKDGKTDIISAGNFYAVLPYEGRYDANYGTVLLNTGNNLLNLPSLQSGLLLDGEVRDSKILRTVGGKSLFIFSRNNNIMKLYKN